MYHPENIGTSEVERRSKSPQPHHHKTTSRRLKRLQKDPNNCNILPLRQRKQNCKMASELSNVSSQHGSIKVLKRNNPFEYPKYTVWRPSPYTLLYHNTSLPHNFYKKFEFIVRTLHFGEYVAARFAECLRISPVKERSHTHLSSYNPPIEVLWFSPAIPENEDRNNWYGNVSIEFHFQNLLENHGDLRFYFVEVVEFRRSIASRILITNKEYNLPLYDPTQKGGPWYRDENGEDKFLCRGRTLNDCIENSNEGLKHELELILDVGDLPLSDDLGPRRIKAANHSEANSGEPHTCKQFRSGHPNTHRPCTSPWAKEETRANLEDIERMIDPTYGC